MATSPPRVTSVDLGAYPPDERTRYEIIDRELSVSSLPVADLFGEVGS